MAQLRSVTCHMGSHSVTCYPTQVNTPCLNPSHTGQYSIYLPRRDGRLSWPSWLNSSQAGRRQLRSSVSGTLEWQSADKNLVVTRSECAALRRGTLCRQNCVPLLCVLTLAANIWKLACSRALTESALDDILRLFILRHTNARIDSLIDFSQLGQPQSKWDPCKCSFWLASS